MARQQQGQANKTYGETQQQYQTANANQNQLYNSLFPKFTAEATNPQGFGAADEAAMNTAASQSVGGSTAGAVGQGNLTAARTRNSGGLDTALDSSVRSGQQTLADTALGVTGQNAQLKQQQQQAGLSGLSSLYGQNNSTMLSALGLGNQATQTGIQAGQSGWFQNLTAGMNAAANVAKSVMPGGITGCWIAEALYGERDPRTALLRSWLNQEFRETPLGAIVMPLYLRFGKIVALAVRLSTRVRNKLRPLFDQALAAAMQERGLESL
jgi:hypothetical protein